MMADELDAVEGDFIHFFRSNHGRLGRALFLLTGDAAVAEDLAQEALVRVYERWRRVRAMRSPVGYLFRIAMNLHRSRWRGLMRGSATESRALDELVRIEDRDELGRLLSRLPIGQRQALVLVEWLEMTAEEAARVLGIKPVSVRVRVSRAKAALREVDDG